MPSVICSVTKFAEPLVYEVRACGHLLVGRGSGSSSDRPQGTRRMPSVICSVTKLPSRYPARWHVIDQRLGDFPALLIRDSCAYHPATDIRKNWSLAPPSWKIRSLPHQSFLAAAVIRPFCLLKNSLSCSWILRPSNCHLWNRYPWNCLRF